MKSIILTTNKNEDNFIDGVKRLANMSMKYYFNESDKGYKKLEEIINNQELWEKENTTEKIKIEVLVIIHILILLLISLILYNILMKKGIKDYQKINV